MAVPTLDFEAFTRLRRPALLPSTQSIHLISLHPEIPFFECHSEESRRSGATKNLWALNFPGDSSRSLC
jgi:hypothetical protein